jgi:hypothetical protein
MSACLRTFFATAIVFSFALMFRVVTRAGVGYQLKFTLNSDIVWDFVVSDTFTVAIGPTVALYVLTQPDHAYGGSPFYEQPVVALTVCIPLPCCTQAYGMVCV